MKQRGVENSGRGRHTIRPLRKIGKVGEKQAKQRERERERYIYIYICCEVTNWATFGHFNSY